MTTSAWRRRAWSRCIEPAFWLGQPRTHVGTYIDYLSMICGFERFRAGQFGIRHYCTIGLNSKEANNEELAEAVMEILPRYALKEGVVAIGEIGYDEQTALEDKYYRAAAGAGEGAAVAGDGPHSASRQAAGNTALHGRRARARARSELGRHRSQQRGDGARGAGPRVLGCFFHLSVHQDGQRAHGRDREDLRRGANLRATVACDWGVSDPLAVPKTAELMRRARIPEEHIRKVTYENPLAAYGKSGQIKEEDWLDPPSIDQRTLYMGNSVLRGGQAPKIEDGGRGVDDNLKIS